MELGPPTEDEPAVASTGSCATEIALHHDHVERGRELLQTEGGPEPRVASADDADVRRDVALELWRRGILSRRGFRRERFVEPHGSHRCHGQSLSPEAARSLWIRLTGPTARRNDPGSPGYSLRFRPTPPSGCSARRRRPRTLPAAE